MAALLVALSVMAVMMTVVMPVWRQAAQREKEEELVFRGQQYARAVGLFEKKYANTPPPTLDVLVQEKFLRKKYKDPITNADFVPIPSAQAAAAAGTGAAAAGRGAAPQAPAPTAAGAPEGRGGGIIGVTSASTMRSIRIYNGGSRYSDWRFVYSAPAPTPGGATGGATGGRGGAGQQGRGQGGAGPLGGPNNGRGQPNDGRGRGLRGGPGGPGGGPQNQGPQAPGQRGAQQPNTPIFRGR